MKIGQHILCLCLVLLSLLACRDKEEGCLDLEATNFDVAADENCCCTYPKLSFRLEHDFDTLNFSKNTPFLLEGQADSIVVEKLQFFIYDIALRQNDTWYKVRDTIQFNYNSGAEVLTTIEIDDYKVFGLGNNSISVGEFLQSGDFDRVKLSLGLPDVVLNSRKNSLASNHLLNDTLRLESGNFERLRLEVQPSTTADNLRIITDTLGTMNQTLERTVLSSKDAGQNLELVFALDYQILFAGIDFSVDTESQILNTLSDNIDAALFLY